MEAKNNTQTCIWIFRAYRTHVNSFSFLPLQQSTSNHQASRRRLAGCMYRSVYVLDVTLAPFIKTSFMKNANAKRTGQPFPSAKPINSCHFRWCLFFVFSSSHSILIYLFSYLWESGRMPFPAHAQHSYTHTHTAHDLFGRIKDKI